MGIWWCIRNPWNECVATDEFGAGTLTGNPADGPSFDACGPAAIENACANLEARTPTYSNIGHIRSDMIMNNQWTAGGEPALMNPRTNGCYISNINWEIPRRNYEVLEYHDYGTVTLDHAYIDSLCQKHDHAAQIYIVTNAQALQGNEHGVRDHFVCVAGYDQDKGSLYILNSDIAGQHGTASGQWISIDSFIAAQPGGVVIFDKPAPTPPPITDSSRDIAIKNALVIVQQDLASVVTALGELQKSVATVVDAQLTDV